MRKRLFVGKLLTLLLCYKVAKVLVGWWQRVRFLKAQSAIAPVPSELAATPWAMLYNFAINAHRQHHFREEVIKKYTNNLRGELKTITGCGVVFNFAPLVLTTDELVVKHILKDNFNNYLRQDFGFQLVFGTSLATVNHGPFAADQGVFFKEQRKNSTKLFTDNNLKGLIGTSIQEHTIKLLGRLQHHIDSKNPKGFPMKDHIHTLTFDVICEIGFGYKFDTKEEESKYQDAFDELFELLPGQVRNPTWKLPFSEKYVPSKMRLITARDLLWSLADKMIDKRLAEDHATISKRGDLLSLYISSGRKGQYSRKKLRDFIMLFLTGGRDTSSNTMHWLTYHLAIDSSLQERLFEETKDYVSIDNNTNQINLDTEKIIQNLLLDGIVMEGLRLYPPVALNGKVAAQDDILPNGLQVQAGTNVMYCTVSMGKDPKRYDEPEEFKPQRWMDPSRKAQSFDEYSFPVFLGGNRVCIGKAVALQEIKMFLVALVYKFRFCLHQDEVNILKNKDVLYSDATFYTYANELYITATGR